MHRVFLDSNILVSAALGGRVGARVQELAETGSVEFLTSSYCWDEAEEAIRRFRPERRSRLRALRVMVSTTGEPSTDRPLPVTLADAEDVPVLRAAVDTQAEYLVTGDRRHFGHLFGHQVEGVTIVDLTGLREALQAEREG